MIEHYRMLDKYVTLDTGRRVTQPLVRDCERQTNSRRHKHAASTQVDGTTCVEKKVVSCKFSGTISKWDFSPIDSTNWLTALLNSKDRRDKITLICTSHQPVNVDFPERHSTRRVREDCTEVVEGAEIAQGRFCQQAFRVLWVFARECDMSTTSSWQNVFYMIWWYCWPSSCLKSKITGKRSIKTSIQMLMDIFICSHFGSSV